MLAIAAVYLAAGDVLGIALLRNKVEWIIVGGFGIFPHSAGFKLMHELHENEQYFFSDETLKQFSDLLEPFSNPCILCAPTLAQLLQEKAGTKRTICALDIDTRFEKLLPGFRLWNLYKPTRIDERFDVIFCDPPFFNCSLSQLFSAIRLLSDFDYSQPIMICYLLRREQALLGTFAKFSLKPTGIFASYKTVQDSERNTIQLYANVDFV